MIKAILFDMDGVIINSEEHWLKKETEMLKKIIPSWTLNDQAGLVGMSINDIYASLDQNYSINISHDDFAKQYDSLAEQIYSKESELYYGMFDLITNLKKRGVLLGLCSSSKRKWIDLVMKRFKLRNYFDAIVSSEDLNGIGKPNPAVYIKLLQDLDLIAEECIAIEDSLNGIVSAKAAGIFCIGFNNGFNDLNHLKQANKIFSDVADIEQYIS